MKRLQAALSLLPETELLADVGCDHGKLCLAALREGKAKKVYACDISAASLEKARCLLKDENAEFYESDGLESVPEDYTAVTICGLGADTALTIVAGCRNNATVILQPQTQPRTVRERMSDFGYKLDAETLAFERGRFYPVMRFIKGEKPLDELQLTFGLNAHSPDETLIAMCEKMREKYESLPVTEKSKATLAAVKQVIETASKKENR